MNRPVRTRTLGGVGRAGETPALTRLEVSITPALFSTNIEEQDTVLIYSSGFHLRLDGTRNGCAGDVLELK
jgi:hypothetical protein